MRKSYNAANKNDIKFCGICFKANDITKVTFIDEKHTTTYCDSLSGALYGYDIQIQQINIHTKNDMVGISLPCWGYRYNDSTDYVRKQTKTFKEDCKNLLSMLEVGTELE